MAPQRDLPYVGYEGLRFQTWEQGLPAEPPREGGDGACQNRPERAGPAVDFTQGEHRDDEAECEHGQQAARGVVERQAVAQGNGKDDEGGADAKQNQTSRRRRAI